MTTPKRPRNKEQAIEVLSDGTIRTIRRKRVKTKIRDKTGEYCCESGNFGQKHKCRKAPAKEPRP
jgi:hypothetical protein